MGAYGSEFGRWLDRTLDNEGLTSREVAQAVGADESAVSRWRRGTRRPTASAVARLARLLAVDVLRLQVTAGLMSADDAGIDPLPMPAADAQRAALHRQLSAFRGLPADVIEQMMAAYDQAMRGDGS